jgi:glycosyltransferase involved in cell wall biosynthesis
VADLPRLLVVMANPLNDRFSNGMTLTSLLTGWPRDRLACVYVPFVAPFTPDDTVCDTFFAVTPGGLRAVRPTPATGGRESAGVAAVRAVGSRLRGRDTLRQLLNPAREWFYARPARVGGPGAPALAAFGAQVVLSTLGLVSLSAIATRLAAAARAPLVPFFTDDWYAHEYAGSPGGARLRARLQRDTRAIVAASSVRLVISDAMADEYRTRFGGDFHPFTRGLDPAVYDPSPPPPRDDPRLVYAGNLAIGRAAALARVADALGRAGQGTLTVHTSDDHRALYAAPLAAHPRVALGPFVPPSALPRLLHDADVLVHVESFAEPHRTYIRLSFSTKLSEYAMAARPILFVGPEDCGSARGARDAGGVVVGSDDPAAIAQALTPWLTDAAARAAAGATARRYAENRFSAVPQRERFRELMRRAAVEPSRSGSDI